MKFMHGFGAACALLAASAAYSQCQYVITATNGTIVPGDTDSGSHCDDCITAIPLPFPWAYYGVSYNSVNASSNGSLQFTTINAGFTNACPFPAAGMTGPTLMPHWDDLRTDGTFNGNPNGIYTSISGVAPNRVFNIEWRAIYFAGAAREANFQVRLYEGQTRADFVYGNVADLGLSATIGIQAGTSGPFTAHSCNVASLAGVQTLRVDCDTLPYPPSVTGVAAEALAGRSSLLMARIVPGGNPPSSGIDARVDLSGIGGSATQQLFNDGTNGDQTAGDEIYSFRHTVPSGTSLGTYNLNVSVSDTQGRNASGVIPLSVVLVGQLPDSAGMISDPTRIDSVLGNNRADMWSIYICDPTNFGATTVGGATFDTQLFLFDADGFGVAMNDDSTGLQSTLTSTFTSFREPGQYYLAISQYNKDPHDAANALIWNNTPFAIERAPDGPGAANRIAQWDAGGAAGGAYTIFLIGVNATSCIDPCVADVDDGSGTGTPDGGVTIEDLLFYLAIFEAGDTRADVDNGTFTGTQDGGVTIDDLLYYIFRFEEGC